MERFSQRGDELLGMRQQRSFEKPQSRSFNNSDMDFDDVFGGPPRRYSMQEVKIRYSFCEPLEEEEKSEDNNEVNSTTFEPWSGLVEKPVFGEEIWNRRRCVNDKFFDDIFKADDNYGSPRRSDYHGSNSGSRIASPVRPLPPPSSELYSTSLPSPFSLLPELTKANNSPGLASDHDITNKNEDAKSNMISPVVSSKSSFSKFLNRAMRGKHEPRGDQYRQSPLSRQASVGNLESLDGLNLNNKKDMTTRKNSEDVEFLVDGSEFHFSIHKWVHGEVPVIIRLREGKTIKVEAMSDQSASITSQTEIKNDDEKSNQDRLDLEEVEHHAVDSQSSMSYYLNEETQRSPNGDKRNNVKKPPSPVQQHPEAELKPLAEGNRKKRDERTQEGRKGAKSANFSYEEKKIDSRKKSSKKTPDSPKTSGGTPHKTGVKGKVRDFVKIFSQETAERSKASSKNQSQSSRWTGRENYGMDGDVIFANKVTEEVDISRSEVKFANMETEEVDISRSEMKFANKEAEEVDISRSEVKFANKATEGVEISRTDGTPNAFRREDEIPQKDEVKQSPKQKNSNPSGRRYTEQKEAPSVTESFSYKATDASSETYFRGSFSVEELSNDQDKYLQPRLDPDYIKISDAKIKQWSQGRKGNIRSLLSTLQLVLWPESGWKPVPLMNIIEGSGVKRAYQRALLCLHPDKLQQKGAAPHQKYIAEKVFDILQEAWDHFNSLGDI